MITFRFHLTNCGFGVYVHPAAHAYVSLVFLFISFFQSSPFSQFETSYIGGLKALK